MDKFELSITEQNSNYANAFIAVGKMLEPRAKFTKIIVTKEIHEGGIRPSYEIQGTLCVNGEECLVQMKQERNPSKGEEIVLNYWNDEGFVGSRSYWFGMFNWKGIMATTPLKSTD